jgi:hypothetical protein
MPQSSKLDHALAAAAMGVRVFRIRPCPHEGACSVKSCGKKPLKTGWQQEATSAPDQIRELWRKEPQANIGWAMGHGFAAIDVDTKDGKPGVESLFRMQLEHGDFPDTLTNQTPTGGRHLVFRADTDYSNSVGLAPGLDVRSKGGYIVGPGSTIAGKNYHLINAAPPVHIPVWFNHVAAKPLKKQDSAPLTDQDTQAAIDNAIRFLTKEAPLAIEFDGGDLTTVKVAMRLRDLAISEPQAFDLMLDNWNARCEPPWDPEELERKVANAYQYAKKQPGNADPNADFEPIEPPADAFPTPFDIDDRAGLKGPDWVVGRIAAREYMSMLVAPGGVGKTNLALAVSYAGATGRGEIIDMEVRRPINVWVLNAEDSKDDMRRRMIAAADLHKITNKDTQGRLYVDSAQQARVTVAKSKDGKVQVIHHEKLIDACKSRKIDLLILDPLINFHGCSENSNDEMGQVADLIRRIGWEAGCAVLLIHHSRKRDKATGAGMQGDEESSRGAKAITDAARIVMTVYTMTEKEAQHHGIPPEERLSYFRLDGGKNNLTARTGQPRWYRNVGVEVVPSDGGEPFETSACTPVSLTAVSVAETGADLARAILRVRVDGETAIKARDAAARLIACDAMFTGKDVKAVTMRMVRQVGAAGVVADGMRVAYEAAEGSRRPAFIRLSPVKGEATDDDKGLQGEGVFG